MPSLKCVIGVGSPHGDDRIGWLIAEKVQDRGGDVVAIHKVGAPLDILERIDGVEWLGICDACRGVGRAGDWHRWTWPDEQLVQHEFTGTHDIGLTAALNLAERLGRLPGKVMVWGIEIASCQPGDDVSPSVMATVSLVADAILCETRISR